MAEEKSAMEELLSGNYEVVKEEVAGKVIIYIDNTYVKIKGLTKSDEKDLWNKLSFEVQVYGQQQTYYRHLYNKTTKMTYTGLLPYVYEFLDDNALLYEVKDLRKKPVKNANFKLVDFIDEEKTIPFIPRPYQVDVINNLGDRGIVQAATGAGKALTITTKVLTSEGFKPMKDIHIGDVIYDKNGKETKVIGEYPQGIKDVYEVEFSDGTIIECDKEHLWEYNTENGIFNNLDNDVNTTEHMLKIDDKLFIPVCNQIQFAKKELSDDPYSIGLSKTNIPIEYLTSSIEDRLSLLRGIINDNVNVDAEGSIYLNVKNEMQSDIIFLLNSLGYRCTMNNNCIFIDNYNFLAITDIRKTTRQEEMKCIMVDSPTHTYICENFIVTHNTCMMAQIIAKHNVKPVMIFADKISLCQQIQSEISKFLGTEVGLVGDGVKDYKDITVCSLLSSDEEYIKEAKLALFDECLTSETEIICEDKNYTIGDIVNNHLSVKVLTYNLDTKIMEFKPITGYLKKPTDKRMLRILINIPFMGNEEIICTDNHKFYTKRGYIEAKDLKEDDIFLTSFGEGKLEDSTDYTDMFYKNIDTNVYDIEVADNHNFYANNVLVSNCHHIPSNTCMEVANKCEKAYYRYGMSATPWRDAGDDMLIEAALSKKGNTMINASTLINLGYLVKPLIMFVPVRETFKGKNYHDIYNKAIVNNEQRNKMIYRIVKKMHEKHKKILILIKNIEHGEKIQEALLRILGEKTTVITVTNKANREKTIRVKNVEFLSGKDESARRQAVIEGMKQGHCDVMIASSVADEGLDLPILDTLILAGGGKSSTRAFQRIGRVIRKYEGKEKAIVFDFVDYTPMLRKHSRVRQKLYKTEPEWDISTFNVNPDAED